MSWFSGKVSLGGFPDIAGAVNKFSESVKNIEKNFDSALGFEEKSDASSNEASGSWSSERKALFDPVMAFMGNKSEEVPMQSSGGPESSQDKTEQKEEVKSDGSLHTHVGQTTAQGDKEILKSKGDIENPEAIEGKDDLIPDSGKAEAEPIPASVEPSEPKENSDSGPSGNSESIETKPKELADVGPSKNSELGEAKSDDEKVDKIEGATIVQSHDDVDVPESFDDQMTEKDNIMEKALPVQGDAFSNSELGGGIEAPNSHFSTDGTESPNELPVQSPFSLDEASMMVSKSIALENEAISENIENNQQINDRLSDAKEKQHSGARISVFDTPMSMLELEKVKTEMKMMESALQGAARQAQAKADEIAKLMNENEQLKGVIENLKRKSNGAEIESLREEYHQRISTLERKVYALTKERDTLRREQSKRSDAAALLKEKDEIITQVMAEGEELSKKQAVQESTIRKLRAQIRELEEEKKGLTTKLQGEENKVESIKRDKAATERLLQETIEKHQVELAGQKEYYTNALTAAKEAEALAEARANSEARTELESRLREAEERETMLVQTLEELRQTLSRKEQQAVFREDMLRRDIEDLQKRYQASERRCEELITQVPESTRPLLRQIEAMQETTARRAEAWAAVERSLNSRLQEAEAKAAAAEERDRSVNERLSQTLSRINVLEAQISCLRAEQTQLSKSLEKERQRAAENRQEYLAAKEEADTQEGRAKQLEEEIRELRRKHKQELQDALVQRELLQQEIEREKTARLDLERASNVMNPTAVSDQTPTARHNSAFENGTMSRKLSSASSLGNMEESYLLEASLGSSYSFSERRNTGEAIISPFYMKSMTPNAFEAALRQKEGELQSYLSRLASMESIRDSLAEELVKMTAQCEKLKVEAAMLPGIRAELEALRRRHSSALELMGERDEELEELRNDIVDLKEMYREQVNLLVNKIQILSSQMDNSS